MFTLLNILFILFSVASAAYFYYKRCYSYWSDRSVPFVEPVFPVGSINRTEFFGLQFAKFYAEVKNGKWPLLGMYFVLKPAALITDLKLTQKVLVTDFNHFQDRGHYYNAKDDPLSANLVNLEMHKWKPLRQKLTPTFSSGRMKHMFPTIIDVGHRFIDCLSNDMKHTNEFDMRDWLGRFLTDVIGTCAFGIEANSLANPDTAFREMGKKFFDQPKISFFSRAITGSYKNLARFLKIKIIHPDVTEFFMNIVEQTIDHREKNNIRRRDFMDMMIQLKNRGSLKEDVHDPAGRLTVNEIAGSAFIFYLGGFGMSSTTLTYTFYELAQPHNRHIQDRVRDEVNNALEKYDGELTYESLSEMRYSEQVINGMLTLIDIDVLNELLNAFHFHRNATEVPTDTKSDPNCDQRL